MSKRTAGARQRAGGQGDGDILAAGATPKKAAALGRAATKEQRRLLEAGRRAHLKDDWRTALKYYDQAWANDPENIDLLTLVAYCLTQLDAREQAMDVVERALKIHGATELLCQILGVLAYKMHFHEIAEKLWREAVGMNPQNAYNYVNLLGAMYEQEKFDEVVAIAQDVLPLFPENSDLWSILATSVQYTDNKAMAAEFFEEALRLNPKNIRALNNYSLYLGFEDRGFEITKRACDVAPDNSEIRVGLAFHHLIRRQFQDAWENYEFRLDPRRQRGQNVIFSTQLPRWKTDSDTYDSILVMNEQGIGDEVYFFRMIPELMKRFKNIAVGCDKRLISIVERSFPGVRAFPAVTREQFGFINRMYPDAEAFLKSVTKTGACYEHLGSLMSHFVSRMEDIPVFADGYLTADPERTKEIAQRLQRVDHLPKIGVSWTSLKRTSSRQSGYAVPEQICDILSEFKGVVVCLQYSAEPDDLAIFRDQFGERFVVFDDIDLKQDIEANLAIMKTVDAVMGPGISTQAFAMALGVPVWFLAKGRPWWNFANEDYQPRLSYSPNVRFFDWHGRLNGWPTCKADYAGELESIRSSNAEN